MCVVGWGVVSMYVLVCEKEETPVFPVMLTAKFFETGSLSQTGIWSSTVSQLNGASGIRLSLSPELRLQNQHMSLL